MKVFVVINTPCCNYPLEVIGVYADPDEAFMAAEIVNSDPSRAHAYATISESLLIGNADD